MNGQRAWALSAIVGVTLVAGCGTVDATADPAAPTSAAAASESPTSDGAATGGAETSDGAATGGAETSDGAATDGAEQTASEGDAALVTEQPAPGDGDINDVVDVSPQQELDQVEATDEVTVSKEVTIEIVEMANTTVTARGPGEIGGPAVSVEVMLSNVTDDPVDLDAVTVTGADESATPLSPLAVDPATPFTGALEPGGQVQGTYLFSFPEGSTEPLTITVSPTPELPVAVFVGTL